MVSINSNIQNLPDFSPYEKIRLCGNNIGAKYLFKVDNFIPIIIGKGDTPKVWLYIKINNNYLTLVEKSMPTIPQIRFVADGATMTYSIFNFETHIWTDVVIIDITNPEIPNITHLNLRPLGLKIFGDENRLMVGESPFTSNEVYGCQTFVNINIENKG